MYNELLDLWARYEELATDSAPYLAPNSAILGRLKVLNAALLGYVHRIGQDSTLSGANFAMLAKQQEADRGN